jgi:hypothetical protein
LLNFDYEHWDSDEREVLRENTAQAIHEQLEAQDNLRSKYERRWIWELFQNALDAAGTNPLNIRITYDGSFTFSHDGLPFARKEILHLIFHGSTKRGSGTKIGRYGTGFLTTHIISRLIRIRGPLDGGEYFDFLLNRSGDSPESLMDSMEQSRLELVNSLSPIPEGSNDLWTKYEYVLDEKAHACVERALSDLSQIAVPVMAFNRRITSIQIDGKIQSHFELLRREELAPGCELLCVSNPLEPSHVKYVAVASEGNLTVALPVFQGSDSIAIDIQPDLPRLFVAFPLFGTETFPFPFVVNSSEAEPTEERNGIFLGSDDDRETNLKNKSLLERSWDLYRTVVDVCISCEWENLHRLGNVYSPPPADWLDSDWLKSLLRTRVENFLFGSKLVQTISDQLISPQEAVFPAVSSPDFHWIVRHVWGDKVVDSEVSGAWRDIILNWHQLLPDLCINEIGPKQLLETVSSCKTIGTLSETLVDGVDTFEWLNRLLKTLTDLQENWNSVPIVPSQSGNLASLLKMQRDDGIDEELKDIADLLNQRVRPRLLDHRISEAVQELVLPLGQDDVIAEVLGALKAHSSETTRDAYISASARLLRWLIRWGRVNELKAFPFAVRATDDRGTNKLSTPEVQLLGPVEAWPLTARPFWELFPAERVIASEYAAVLEESDWELLKESQICFLDPVFTTLRQLDQDEVSALIQDVRSIEDDEHLLEAFQVSDILFLSLKDRGLLDSARGSKVKSTMMLRFVFDHVLAGTGNDLEFREVQCSCGNKHSLHAAAWISPLRDRKWVYESKGHAGHVSPTTLANLLKSEGNLFRRLGEASVFKCLVRMGVSPSDLQRASADLPATEMDKLERAILEVLSAGHNDPQRIVEIAELVVIAPEVLEEYAERKKQRERVRRNQALGKLIEDLFAEIFSSEEMRSLGLKVNRTGVGSDFSLEYDFVDDGEESLFGISGPNRELLVELKATLGRSAAMTHTQARRATEAPFALCVVPLEDHTPTIEAVRTQSRFVSNIGELLKEKVNQVQEVKALQLATGAATEGISVDIEEGQIRYRVDEQVWARAMTLDQFAQYLVAFLCAPPAG